MKRSRIGVSICLVALFTAAGVQAQQRERPGEQTERMRLAAAAEPEAPGQDGTTTLGTAPELSVFSVMKFSGVLTDATGAPRTGMVGITFAFYSEQEGGAPLWLETQNAELDAEGRYTVLLGSTQSEGLPLHLFTSGEARWLGIQVHGQEEQPRILLVSVPYALKAAEAETLAGRPASDFVLAEELEQEVRREVETQVQQELEANDLATTGEGLEPKAVQTYGAAYFRDSTNSPVVTVEQRGGGMGLYATAKRNTAVVGNSEQRAGPFFGVQGRSLSRDGSGVLGITEASSGDTSGVYGISYSRTGRGVTGEARHPSGGTFGVFGVSYSPKGRGVYGEAMVPLGGTFGVYGETWSGDGWGVYGLANASGGTTTGVHGEVRSAAGTAGVFDNMAGGNILSGRAGGSQVFSVDGSGTVTATSFVGDGSGLTNVSATTADADTLDGLDSAAFARVAAANTFSGTQTAPNFVATGSVSGSLGSFSGSTSDPILHVVQNAPGIPDADLENLPPVAVVGDATATNDSAVGVAGFAASPDGLGVVGVNTSPTGDDPIGVFGIVTGATGYGVQGEAVSLTGRTVGVRGEVRSPEGVGVEGEGGFIGVLGTIEDIDISDGTGVLGQSLVPTGVATGVWGTVDSSTDWSSGVFGLATATSGLTFGVLGNAASSDGGVGVGGAATATTGVTHGVAGRTYSPDGIAGTFQSMAGGKILKGTSGPTYREVFSVEGNGDVVVHEQGRGIILKSPGGTCALLSIDDSGTLLTSLVTCPPTSEVPATAASQVQAESGLLRRSQETLDRIRPHRTRGESQE
jgi:hypothetical protein